MRRLLIIECIYDENIYKVYLDCTNQQIEFFRMFMFDELIRIISENTNMVNQKFLDSNDITKE